MVISNVPISVLGGCKRTSQKLRIMFSFKISKLVNAVHILFLVNLCPWPGPWSLLVACAYISCPHILTIACCSPTQNGPHPKSQPPFLDSQHKMHISESTSAAEAQHSYHVCVGWTAIKTQVGICVRFLFCPYTTVGWRKKLLRRDKGDSHDMEIPLGSHLNPNSTSKNQTTWWMELTILMMISVI